VTADRFIVGALVVLFLVAIAFDVCDVHVARAPSVRDCAEDWNERAASTLRMKVISGEFHHADVTGWLAKRSYPGCGIVFVTQRDLPWWSCVRTFEAGDPRLTDWSCEGGDHWGRARSSGSKFLPNATVRSDAMLTAQSR
jgi:hypothetical protein